MSELVKERLDRIIEKASERKIRLLIEVDLASKVFVYCDDHEKTLVLEWLKEERFADYIHMPCTYEIKFPSAYPSYKFLPFSKGKNIQRLHKDRTLDYQEITGRKVLFFDMEADEIKSLSKFIPGKSFIEIQDEAYDLNKKIIVNYDRTTLLFYGK